MLKPIRGLLHTILSDARGIGGALDPAAVHIGLYTAIVGVPGPDQVLANLTEATYTGYARQPVTAWTDPFNTQAGLVAMMGNAKFFTPADAVTPNTILGWFLASALAGGTLLAIEQLDTPATLPNADSTLTVVPQVAMNPTLSYGEGVEVN